jgi:hypothetical protein
MALDYIGLICEVNENSKGHNKGQKWDIGL